MSLRRAKRSSLGGRPGDAAAYRRQFVRMVHRVLAVGFRRLVAATRLLAKEETAITGLLVDQMRALVQGRDCPKGAEHFAIHDDRPESGEAVEGRRRPRIDIVVERTGKGRWPQFHVEAKRLNRPDSVAEYIGNDGVGCFLSGKYAKDEPDAGMLGYIQQGTPQTWATRLGTKLATMGWTEHPLDVSLPHSYVSSHMRNGRKFELFHVLLVCA